jgi:hypothetical protein
VATIGGKLGAVGWAWGGLGTLVATVTLLVAVRDPVFADVDRGMREPVVSSAEVEELQALAASKKPRSASSAGSLGGQKPDVFPNPFGGDKKPATDDDTAVLPGQDVRDAQNEMELKLRRNDLKGALGALEKLVELDPKAPKDPKIRESIVELTQRLTLLTTGEPERMFGMLAKKMGTTGIDILYQLVTTKGGSRAAKLAESLLLQDEVLERGSPALQVAWKLRRAKTCEARKAIFPDAAKDGDGRTLGQLYILDRMCGRRRRDPGCCAEKDPELKNTMDALKARGFQ